MKIRKDDYIRNSTYTSILGSNLPVVQVKNVTDYSINGKHVSMDQRESYVVISKSEAEDIMEFFNSISISHIPVEDKEFVCKREDNGNPKEPISVFHIKEVYFRYKMLNPAFSAYRCPKCLQYHLGKTKS